MHARNGKLWGLVLWISLAVPSAADAGDDLNNVQKLVLRPLAAYPAETRLAILALCTVPDLVTQMLEDPARFQDSLSGALDAYPAEVRAGARELVDSPEVLQIIHSYPKYAAIIGAIYRSKPREVEAFVLALPGPGGVPAVVVPGAFYPTPSDRECWADDPAVLAQVEQIRAIFAGYAGRITENAEILTYILENWNRFQELALALLNYAGEVPLEAVAAWIARMEEQVGASYSSGTPLQFLQHLHLVRQVPGAKGRFWEAPDARAAIRVDLAGYSHLAGKLLEEHVRAPLAGIEEWKENLARVTKLQFDAAQPRAFAELAGFLAQNPNLSAGDLKAGAGLEKVLENFRSLPSASRQLVQGPTANATLESWKSRNAAKFSALTRNLGQSAPARTPAKPQVASPAKKAQISQAAKAHVGSWKQTGTGATGAMQNGKPRRK